MNSPELEAEYKHLVPSAEKFTFEIARQMEELLSELKVTQGFPLQKRVKSWESISEKIDRFQINIKNIRDVKDLIGLRITLLFHRDALTVCEMIRGNCNILEEENTTDRLGDSEFGYSSIHFSVEPKAEWMSIPSFARIGKFQVEIQVRTIAQHLWAATSHLLQYKQKSNVPQPVRRAISRVAALLEMVDLELERVLSERSSYLSEAETNSDSEQLNVDLLAKLLDELLPKENKKDDEPYAELLEDLSLVLLRKIGDLREMVMKHLCFALAAEKTEVKLKSRLLKNGTKSNMIGTSKERLERGVFFSHVGLVRKALSVEFGEAWHLHERTKAIKLKQLNKA